MGKKSHEKWAKELALKKKKQEDVVGPQSDLAELEDALKDSEEEKALPMDVDSPKKKKKGLGLKLKKKIEKTNVKKRKSKKEDKAVVYQEKLENKLARTVQKKRK
jgi:hypothetical protein